jgi:hypothetical protein
MHILRFVRRRYIRQCLPELRGRFCTEANQAIKELEEQQFFGQPTSEYEHQSPDGGYRYSCHIFRSDQGDATREAIAKTSPDY